MSDEQPPNAVFNIGSQQGNVSNVAGNQTIYGGQQAILGVTTEIARQVSSLREALDSVELDPAVKEQADALMDEANRELAQPEPSLPKAARPIEKLTDLLKDAGALTAAGAALVDPIRSIGSLLGAAGGAILSLLL